MFNLPFALLDKYGPNCVYPDLSGIVYRRLWLQHAPRKVNRLFTACEGCFYRQTMTIDEVQRQYHLSPATVFASPHIRGNKSPWILRVDVEALALQLYRTREFHDAHPEQFDKPCLICAITTFTDKHDTEKRQTSHKIAVRQAGRKAKMRPMRQ
ncbi:hypothetical protein yc1106_01443 [Curvularia clavata]|uniref:Uncharacterized protein n=1 Tax=Curvularia clavata TaxID=95742 RepID=A0A9Q9DPZ9_CURCL|nr:hypothetical protein yc1106_01443 [Curvularia clavata]